MDTIRYPPLKIDHIKTPFCAGGRLVVFKPGALRPFTTATMETLTRF
jgi:hypothetical protein